MSDQQQWGQPPAERKKSHWLRNTIGGLTAFIVVMTVFGALAGGDEAKVAAEDKSAANGTANSDTENEPAGEIAAEKAPGIGDPVRDGKFEFTVTRVKAGVKHVGDQDFGSDAQGEFTIVSVTVRNIGDRAQMLDSSSQTAYDGKGREFKADGEAGISLDSKAFLEDLNPGNSVKAKLVFDVPSGTDLARLELHDSAFSGGVEVDL